MRNCSLVTCVISLIVFCINYIGIVESAGKPDPSDCEVCISVLSAIETKVKGEKELTKIEDTIGNHCTKPANEKENKLCYYIDPIKREVSTPMKNGVPPSVICQRLKKKAPEICSLRYTSTSSTASAITASTDLSTLKISQLKTFMAEKNIVCNDCIEKADFVAKIKSYFDKKEL